jgi:hypothetical protein
MGIDKPLAYKAFGSPTIKESEEFSRFQSSVERNWDSVTTKGLFTH